MIASHALARGFASNADGNVAIIFAGFLGVAMAASSFAIDLGMIHVQRRDAQSAADLAAIAAAADPARQEDAARASLAANGITSWQKLAVVSGRYEPDADVAPANRFVAGAEPANAARVELVTTGQTYFARSFMSTPVHIGVSAVATSSADATFSIGSRLASLNGGVANALLGAMLGSSISLSAMDYRALLDADIKLVDFMDALATELHITSGTYQDVLNASVTVGKVLAALGSVAADGGHSEAKVAIDKLLASKSGQSLAVPLSKSIDLGALGSITIGQAASGFDASFSILQLVTSSITAANGTHQLTIDLGASVPGIASVKLQVLVGEPMQSSAWASVGQPGSTVRTAQTRIILEAQLLGAGVLSGATAKLPLYMEVANAEAQLADVTCRGGDASAAVDATSGVAEVWIGTPDAGWTNPAARPTIKKADIVKTVGLTVAGSAHVVAGNTSPDRLTFTSSDVEDGTIQSTKTKALVGSLVSSLLSNLALDVKILGLSLLKTTAVTAQVGSTLAPAAAPLDALVNSLLAALGLNIGEADVRLNGLRCHSPVLNG